MIKNFKPMSCPVCNEFYFTDDTEDEKAEPGYEGKKDAYCMQCGWKYDLYQAEHPDAGNLTNELSVNEYRKCYAKKIALDPDYTYLKERYPYDPQPHLCPVCGRYEFPDEGSHDICPYCGWEDDDLMEENPDKWEGTANPLTLNDSRKAYQEKIRKDPNYKWEDNH